MFGFPRPRGRSRATWPGRRRRHARPRQRPGRCSCGPRHAAPCEARSGSAPPMAAAGARRLAERRSEPPGRVMVASAVAAGGDDVFARPCWLGDQCTRHPVLASSAGEPGRSRRRRRGRRAILTPGSRWRELAATEPVHRLTRTARGRQDGHRPTTAVTRSGELVRGGGAAMQHARWARSASDPAPRPGWPCSRTRAITRRPSLGVRRQEDLSAAGHPSGAALDCISRT